MIMNVYFPGHVEDEPQVLQETRGEVELSLDWLEMLVCALQPRDSNGVVGCPMNHEKSADGGVL